MNEKDKSVTVNKKHKSPNVPPRGGMSLRGGRGGFGFYNRGGFHNANRGGGVGNRGGANANRGRGGGNNNNVGNRGVPHVEPAGVSNAFNGKCYGCRAYGHRIEHCPQRKNNEVGANKQ